MPRIKIKQLDTRIACDGIHFGGSQARRKLHPGEIVDIPEDFEAGQYKNGQGLFDVVYATGKVEITTEMPNRPLDFEDERVAKMTAPTYKLRGPDDERDIAEMWEKIDAELAEQYGEKAPAPAPKRAAPAVTETPPAKPRNRRAQRRGAKAPPNEQANTA